MEAKLSKSVSLVLFVLISSMLVLPAWGAPPNKKTIYGKVAIVAKSGGDYTSPVAAMANVSTGDNWCGTPSATNLCLVKIMSGEYDLGTATLTMQPYVDIEGSGEEVTVITSTQSINSISQPLGLVNGASNAEISFLTVNAATSGVSVAIANNSASPKITHVTAMASGTSDNYAVYNRSSSPTMSNVTATASGGTACFGVVNTASSSPTMSNVTATASGTSPSYGVANISSSPTMSNVTATASGAPGNFGVYNVSSSSPTMSNVTATASGGSGNNYGVFNASSSPTMSNVTATASGTSLSNYGVGVYNDSSSPTMSNVTATAKGESLCYGVWNDHSSAPTMSNVTATGDSSTPTASYGMYNNNGSSTSADRSTFYAIGLNSTAVYNSNSTLNIGSSKICPWSTNDGTGTITCVASYNCGYAAIGTNCQPIQ